MWTFNFPKSRTNGIWFRLLTNPAKLTLVYLSLHRLSTCSHRNRPQRRDDPSCLSSSGIDLIFLGNWNVLLERFAWHLPHHFQRCDQVIKQHIEALVVFIEEFMNPSRSFRWRSSVDWWRKEWTYPMLFVRREISKLESNWVDGSMGCFFF